MSKLLSESTRETAMRQLANVEQSIAEYRANPATNVWRLQLALSSLAEAAIYAAKSECYQSAEQWRAEERDRAQAESADLMRALRAPVPGLRADVEAH